MKLYNNNTGKIEEVPAMVTINGAQKYSSKLTEAELNQAGYYKVTAAPAVDKRYYKEGPTSFEIVDGKAVKTIEAIELDVEHVKTRLLKQISDSFKKFGERPAVDTGLGYSVDGSLDDLRRFEIGAELGITIIKDIDGNAHDIDAEGYATVIGAIKAYGLSLYELKWQREAEVAAITSIDGCQLFEREPYEEDRLIVDENGDPILDADGNKQYETVTKYRDKTREW